MAKGIARQRYESFRSLGEDRPRNTGKLIRVNTVNGQYRRGGRTLYGQKKHAFYADQMIWPKNRSKENPDTNNRYRGSP